MHYDKGAKIIWLRMESNIVNVGPMSSLSGMILTEKGVIPVIGFSLKNDFSTYEPVFRSSTISVVPSQELTYKPKWSDNLPAVVRGIDWEKAQEKAYTGAIMGLFLWRIFAIFALLAGLLRKKKGRW